MAQSLIYLRQGRFPNVRVWAVRTQAPDPCWSEGDSVVMNTRLWRRPGREQIKQGLLCDAYRVLPPPGPCWPFRRGSSVTRHVGQIEEITALLDQIEVRGDSPAPCGP